MKQKRDDSGIFCDLNKRVITLHGRINLQTASKLLAWLHTLEERSLTEPVNFIFNGCIGGDWIAAKHMYASIRRILPPTVGIAKKYVNSAAIAVFAAAQERYAMYGTSFAFHTSDGSRLMYDCIRKREERATARYHARLTKETVKIDEEIFSVLTEGFGFTNSYTVRFLCEAEITLTLKGACAREAVEYGIVHHIVRPSSRKRQKKYLK